MTRDDSNSDSSDGESGQSNDRLSRRRFVAAATAVGASGLLGTGTAAGTPYGGSRHAIPGRIQAENYDTDGSGTAYNDTTAGNAGGAYRSEDVDIEATSGGGYNVGWTKSGEWLNYSSAVDTTGTYEVTARVASGGGGGSFTLQQDQVDLATFSVPDTGGWQSWTTVTREVDLDSGDRFIAVYFASGGVNLDWLDFSLVSGGGGSGSGQSAYAAHSFPGRIQAEDYDTGGEGVAYHDTTSGNAGGAYRSEDVDIEPTSGGGYNVGWITTGEWLEYTVDVTAGTYDLNARVASNAGGGSFRVEVGGTNVTGTVTTPGTGGWQSWTTTTATGVSVSGGTQTVRVYVESGGFNLDWIELVESGSGGGGSAKEDDKYVPYLQTWSSNSVQKVRDSGVEAVHIGFVLGSSSGPQLGNKGAIGTTDWASRIQQIQDMGVEVRITIGGWDSNTVSAYASSVSELVGWYEDILDTYGVTHLDIDDENADDRNQQYSLRNKALAELQSRRPEVTVSYTVPATQSGIANMAHSPARDMVSDAIATGVDLEYVNIMTMDFQPTDASTIQNAAQAIHDWLGQQYPNKSATARWEMLGITPMNGVQNDTSLTLTVSEATALRDWAEQHDIGMLTIWSLDRDASGSGIGAAPYAFSDVFGQFEADED